MVAIWTFALGLVTVSALPFFIPTSLLIAAAALLAALGGIRSVFRYAALIALGLLINTWQVQSLCRLQLAPELDGLKQYITFSIVSLPQQRERSTVFIAQVQAMDCQQPECQALVSQKVRLAWYRPQQTIVPGQVWSAQVKLKRPRGFANPGGFDYQAWLLGQGVMATGYVHSDWQLNSQSWAWASVRQAVAEQITQAAGDGGYKRFWPALLVADRSQVTAADWQTLQATGTIHLMAISGLHIGLISLWAFWLGRLISRLCTLRPRFSGGWVAHYLPPLLSSCMAIVYAALAGFSVPTVRACIACLVMNFCWLIGLRMSALTLLGFGLAVVALAEPLAWQNQGFWLSFAAVFLLLHTMAGRVVRRTFLDGISMQLVLSFGLSVPLLWLGQGISWVSPFANVIAVPVVSFIVVPALFLASALTLVSQLAGQWVLSGLDWVFALLWQYLLWLEAAPRALLWPTRAVSAWSLAAAFAGILLLLAPRGLGGRGLGGICLGLALLIRPPSAPLKLTVMDVGQGLSVVVQTPDQTWIYDTGPAFSDSFDAGSRIIAPYLRAQGIRQIDVMVSHGDNDHSGGTEALVSAFDVRSLRVGEPLPLAPVPNLPLPQRCHQGQRWSEGALAWEVLWPPADAGFEGNDASCVVLLQLSHRASLAAPRRKISVLLTGDIDRAIEAKLLPLLPSTIDIVIAPHHGSKSSSSASFVRTLNADVAVFSTGYKSRYGHPHPEVLQRYIEQGARAFNTAESGALVFEWTAEAATISETRVDEPKLWYR